MITTGEVTIYGESLDTIVVDGGSLGDVEYTEDDASFLLTGFEGAVRVWVKYRDGCWMIGCSPAEEGTPMLPVKMDQAHGYSARAVVSGVRLVELETCE